MSTVSVYLRHISETTSKPQPRTKPSLRRDYFVIRATSGIANLSWNSIDNHANGPSNNYIY